MAGSTLEVTNLPPDINDADCHHLFSQSGCIGSRLERDGNGRYVATRSRLRTQRAPPNVILHPRDSVSRSPTHALVPD